MMSRLSDPAHRLIPCHLPFPLNLLSFSILDYPPLYPIAAGYHHHQILPSSEFSSRSTEQSPAKARLLCALHCRC